jgi:hypothetical protein
MRQCNGICPVGDLAAGSAVPRRPSAMQQQQLLLLVLVTPDPHDMHVFFLHAAAAIWAGEDGRLEGGRFCTVPLEYCSILFFMVIIV